MEKSDWVKASVYTPLLFLQLYQAWAQYNSLNLDVVSNLGWFILSLSAIFGWVPIFTLKKEGNVPDGESYMKTTKLVDSGIYSIIRHPQFFAGILLSISLMLISQHWTSIISAIIVVPIFYQDCINADQALIEKFGEEYMDYMKKVPRVNFVLGLIRVFRDKDN